jgi:hypothetical protein
MKIASPFTWRKIVLAAPLIAGLVGGLGLGTIGTAHADSEDFAIYGYKGDGDPFAYRDELRMAGLNHEDVHNARDLSGRLCAERALGYTQRQVLWHLEQSPDGYTVHQQVAMLGGAEFHFCPSFSSRDLDS